MAKHPGTQVETQNKDFEAGSWMDLSRGLILSLGHPPSFSSSALNAYFGFSVNSTIVV